MRKTATRTGAAPATAFLAALAVSLLGPLLAPPLVAPAFAQGGEEADLVEAKRSFDEGQVLYLQSRFAEAAGQFEKAYAKKPYPAFLFNEAVCREKAGEIDKAIDRYARYVVSDPKAAERPEIEQRIEGLRRKMAAQVSPTSAAPALPDVKTRGLVVVESKPAEAQVWLDDKNNPSVGTTPFSATLEGKHTIFVEMKGYTPEKKTIESNPNQLTYLYIALSKEHYLGWIEIVTPGVPGADVYLDRREAGVVGKTPYMGNLRPGKHVIWIEREGFAPLVREVEVLPGGTHRVEITPQAIHHGFIVVMGKTTKGATVKVDEREIDCRGQYPCRIELPAGRYHVEVGADGRKSYGQDVEVVGQSETKVRVQLNDRPPRTSAYVTLGIGVALITTGSVFGVKSKSLRQDLEDDVDDPGTLVAEDDERISKGRLYAILADGMWIVGGIVTGLGVYYLFTDEGPESVGETEAVPLALAPYAAPDGGGLAAAVTFK